MDRGLKERLVGAAVLVALAVIFIPMLLDDAPSGPGPITDSNIPVQPQGDDGFSSRIVPAEPDPVTVEPPPPEPDPDAAPASEPAAPAATDSQESRETAAVPPAEPEAPEAAAEPDAKPEPSAEKSATDKSNADDPTGDKQSSGGGDSEVSGWVIQLGSFAKQDNAEDLNKQLREAGYEAFVEPVTQSGRRVYRVRVGPEVLREEAEKLRDAINKKFDLKGIVVSYPD